MMFMFDGTMEKMMSFFFFLVFLVLYICLLYGRIHSLSLTVCIVCVYRVTTMDTPEVNKILDGLPLPADVRMLIQEMVLGTSPWRYFMRHHVLRSLDPYGIKNMRYDRKYTCRNYREDWNTVPLYYNKNTKTIEWH
jgi:hypothetical protein